LYFQYALCISCHFIQTIKKLQVFVATVPSNLSQHRVDESRIYFEWPRSEIFGMETLTGPTLERDRPQLNNENAYGSLYNYKWIQRDNYTANAFFRSNFS
jgi:hypothetical protein